MNRDERETKRNKTKGRETRKLIPQRSLPFVTSMFFPFERIGIFALDLHFLYKGKKKPTESITSSVRIRLGRRRRRVRVEPRRIFVRRRRRRWSLLLQFGPEAAVFLLNTGEFSHLKRTELFVLVLHWLVGRVTGRSVVKLLGKTLLCFVLFAFAF